MINATERKEFTRCLMIHLGRTDQKPDAKIWKLADAYLSSLRKGHIIPKYLDLVQRHNFTVHISYDEIAYLTAQSFLSEHPEVKTLYSAVEKMTKAGMLKSADIAANYRTLLDAEQKLLKLCESAAVSESDTTSKFLSDLKHYFTTAYRSEDRNSALGKKILWANAKLGASEVFAFSLEFNSNDLLTKYIPDPILAWLVIESYVQGKNSSSENEHIHFGEVIYKMTQAGLFPSPDAHKNMMDISDIKEGYLKDYQLANCQTHAQAYGMSTEKFATIHPDLKKQFEDFVTANKPAKKTIQDLAWVDEISELPEFTKPVVLNSAQQELATMYEERKAARQSAKSKREQEFKNLVALRIATRKAIKFGSF